MQWVRFGLTGCALVGVVLATSQDVRGQRTLAPNRVPPRVVRQLLEGRGRLELVPGELIIKHRVVSGVPMVLPQATLTRVQVGPRVKTLSGGEGLYRIAGATIAALTPQAARQRTLAVVEQLRASPEVEYVQPNFIHRIAAAANDPGFVRQWHYFDNGTEVGRSPGGISLPKAWQSNNGDSSIVVAVIDTGILPNHEDIAGSPNLVAGYDMISSTQTSNDGDGRDGDPTDPGDAVAANECYPGSPALPDSWHGTHVAGTVGVVRTGNSLGVAGVNWDARVQAVRVLGKCGGSTTDINDAIRWAAGLAVPGEPTNPTPARVINLSLRAFAPCSDSPSTQAAIDDAVAAGAAVVVAAGNDAVDASQVFPASCDNVITVAASDARGQLVTRYSNFGSLVEILAPGGDVERDDDDDGNPDGVYSTVKGGYAYYNGTSMAAPHVAGVAALLLASQPSLTPAQVSQHLQQAALPRTLSQCPRPCGAGLLSAAAVTNLLTSPARVNLDRAGDTETLQAIVSQAGQPVAGASVTFTSDDTSIATVNPPTGVTDSTGAASTTVTAQQKGRTQVNSRADDAQRKTPVKVPALSASLVVLLSALLIGVARHLTRSEDRA